jgi:hypothetical protein
MRCIELTEGALSPDQQAERSKLDREIDAARNAFNDARERKDAQQARESLTRFNNAVRALMDFDAQFETPDPPRPEGYTGEHEAPDHENGKPLFDLSGIYPNDFYTGHSSLYGDNQRCIGIMLSLHNRPNALIQVYRAVPKTAPRKINAGDWVTIDRRYAVEHGRDNLRNEFHVVSKTVFARDLFTDGNSFEEWGYDPQPRVRRR